MPILESAVEGPVVRFARSCGVEVVKLNGIGKRSLPDRMFLYAGRSLFIEFKRPGGEPTPLQRHLHKRWSRLGHRVYVVDSKDEGVRLVKLVLLSSTCPHDYSGGETTERGGAVWCMRCGVPLQRRRGRWVVVFK